jgi:hypothetical protein
MRSQVVENYGSLLVEQGFDVHEFQRPDTILKKVLAALKEFLALTRDDPGLLQIP